MKRILLAYQRPGSLPQLIERWFQRAEVVVYEPGTSYRGYDIVLIGSHGVPQNTIDLVVLGNRAKPKAVLVTSRAPIPTELGAYQHFYLPKDNEKLKAWLGSKL